MSLIRLNDGTKYEVEQANHRYGLMRNRSRGILEITFSDGPDRFEEIKGKLTEDNLSSITVYYPDEKETATDEQLEGVSQELYEHYTLIGKVTEEDTELEPETATDYAVWGKRLMIEIGQTLLSERSEEEVSQVLAMKAMLAKEESADVAEVKEVASTKKSAK